MASHILIKKEQAAALCQGVFEALELPAEHARAVSEGLVWASMRGIDSHGLIRLASYVRRLDQGAVNPKPKMKVSKDLPGAMIVEGDHGHGQVTLTWAMERAIEKARNAAIGWVLVRESKHAGAVGYYTRMAAEAGMAGLYLGASQPNMEYFGSRVEGVATNPIAISVPGKNGRILSLDMATAVAGVGKLMHYKATNETLKEGWALDSEGNPTIDPQKAEIPTALGGPKGSSMSLLFECMTSLMVASPLVSRWHDGSYRRHQQNGLVAAVNIADFTELEAYKTDVEALITEIKKLPKADGVEEILVPGERSDRIMAERERLGIPVPIKTWLQVCEVAERFAVRIPEVKDFDD
ncbi:MAG: Ldh family oxidoreductase, partial [Alphaproteobacteria bacterium]